MAELPVYKHGKEIVDVFNKRGWNLYDLTILKTLSKGTDRSLAIKCLIEGGPLEDLPIGSSIAVIRMFDNPNSIEAFDNLESDLEESASILLPKGLQVLKSSRLRKGYDDPVLPRDKGLDYIKTNLKRDKNFSLNLLEIYRHYLAIGKRKEYLLNYPDFKGVANQYLSRSRYKSEVITLAV